MFMNSFLFWTKEMQIFQIVKIIIRKPQNNYCNWLVLDGVEHELVVEEADEVEAAKAGGAP